jgi:hypothetical protein
MAFECHHDKTQLRDLISGDLRGQDCGPNTTDPALCIMAIVVSCYMNIAVGGVLGGVIYRRWGSV